LLLFVRVPHIACEDGSAGSYFATPAERNRTITHRLAVARELLLRDAHKDLLGKSVLDSPAAVRDDLRLHFASLPSEVFMALYLNARHAVIDCVELFKGTLTQCAVYPREAVRCAIERNACAVVFAHNHPTSGSAEPSRADELLTHALKAALATIDVRVVDHLVFGGGQFVSFAERDLL